MNDHRLKKCPRFFLLLAAAGLAAGGALASPLPRTTAVQSAPEPSAPIITYLKAGSEAAPAPEASAVAAPGWMAVSVPGPFEGYVLNKDLTKGLDVKPGSAIYLAPSKDAGVLRVAARGDKTEITGLHGKWTQVRLDQSLVGYIDLNPAVVQPPAAPAGAAMAPVPLTDSSPALPPAAGANAPPGRDVTADSGNSSSLPQALEGRLVSTWTLLPFHHPYAWQLLDDSGNRVAYLDLSRLMLTDQIERYINHQVQVFGIVSPLANGKDIVIAAENLQLR